MLNVKDIKRQVTELARYQRALTAAVKGLEGAIAASPDDPMPPAAGLMIDTMVTRSAELSAAVKNLESAIKNLQRSATPSVRAAAD